MDRLLTRRRLFAAAASGLGGAALAACGAAPAPTTAPAAPATAGATPASPTSAAAKPATGAARPPVELTYWHLSGAGWKDGTDKLLDRFATTKADEMGIKLSAEAMTGGGAEKIAAAAVANTLPNVIQWDYLNLSRYIVEGKFVNLTERLPKDWYAAWKADTPDYQYQIKQIKDHLYGFHLFCWTWAVFRNKQHFDEAGVAAPKAGWGWDDLVTTGKALTRQAGGQQRWGWRRFHRGVYVTLAGVLNGAPVFDITTGATRVMEPAFLKGLEFAVDLVEKHQIANKPDIERGWENGAYAMVEYDNSGVKDFQKAGLTFDVVPYPVGPDTGGRSPSFVNSYDLFVTKGTPEQEEAAIRFAQWYTDAPQQAEFGIATGYMPTRKSARQIPAYREYLAQDPRRQVFDQLLDTNPVTVKATPNLTKKRELVAKQWDLALNVKLTPREAMAEAVKLTAPLDDEDRRALGL